MGLFSNDAQFDRRETMARAQKHLDKGNKKRAIAALREILAHDADDADSHAKIAPLLAQHGEPGAAWSSFRSAAEALHVRGFTRKSIATYHQAMKLVPQFEDGWLRIAELELVVERPHDALAALKKGRTHYRRAYDRPRAIKLLRRALEMSPDDIEFTVDLSRQLKKEGQRAAGRALLMALTERSSGSARRRLRRYGLWLFPSPRTFWSWLARR